MRSLALIAILVLAYFTANYMLAAVIDIMWREGVIPGTEETWRAYGGLLRTVPMIAGIILTVPFGMLADKLGRVRVLLLVGVLMGISLLLISASPNYYILLAGFSIFGIAMMGSHPAIMGLIADITREARRGLGYAIYYMSTVIGYPLGLAIGITLYWRIGYSALGALTLLLALIIYAVLSKAPGKGAVPEGKKAYRARAALRSALVASSIILVIMALFWGMPWGAVTTYAVDYLVSAWGISKGSATIILTVSSLSIILGHLLGGILGDRGVKRGDYLARVKVSLIGVAIGTVVMLVFVLYPYPYGNENIGELIKPIALAGFGMLFTTFAYPNLTSVLSEVVREEHRSTVFSVYNVTNNIGWGLGPFIYGILIPIYRGSLGIDEISAMRYSITTVVAMWVITLGLWLALYRTYPKDRVAKG